MNVLVVGGGGREHAIVWALSKSPKVTGLFCAPGNAGIAQLAQCVDVKATDVSGMVAWAKENHMDFVVVAPDDPLALGMVDALEEAGIPAFGPRANAAVIEASKSFSKDLMAKYHIPTARYQTFTDLDQALAYIRAQGAPIVVKADGLALGKGVVVAQTVAEAEEAARSMMAGKKFGDAGARVVIEECMTGPEVTVLAFCDGKHLVPMPSSQDHKRAFDGNQGPNTGGMGAISPVPAYTRETARTCMETIFQPTVDAMAAEGRPFQGVLYFGLMLTPQGPKVVEYNARFGDPECQVVLSLLDSDLMDILQACVDVPWTRWTSGGRMGPPAWWCWPPGDTPPPMRRASPSPAWRRRERPPSCSMRAPSWAPRESTSPTAAGCWASPPPAAPWPRPSPPPMPPPGRSPLRRCTSAPTSAGRSDAGQIQR